MTIATEFSDRIPTTGAEWAQDAINYRFHLAEARRLRSEAALAVLGRAASAIRLPRLSASRFGALHRHPFAALRRCG